VTRTYSRIGPLVFLLLAGCGPSLASVSGEVTYEGQPVTNGSITFAPADGKGQVTGATIANGRFTVEKVPPGPKVVKVEAVKDVPFARDSAEMAKRAASARARGDRSGIIDRADVVPADAVGNNAQIEVKPGKQELSFHLKKPAGPRPR
jgi:hypothetical protein